MKMAKLTCTNYTGIDTRLQGLSFVSPTHPIQTWDGSGSYSGVLVGLKVMLVGVLTK